MEQILCPLNTSQNKTIPDMTIISVFWEHKVKHVGDQSEEVYLSLRLRLNFPESVTNVETNANSQPHVMFFFEVLSTWITHCIMSEVSD